MSAHRAYQRLSDRLRMVIGRGRIKTGDDSGPVQKQQVVLGPLEVHDNIPRLSEFGFASMPPEDSDVTIAFFGGDRSNGVIVATGHQQTRLKNLAMGDAAIYDALGKYIWLKKDGGIVIEAKNADVTINNAATVKINATVMVELNTPKLKVDGDIEATGTITGDADVKTGSISLASHKHGGVETGGGQTGGPV